MGDAIAEVEFLFARSAGALGLRAVAGGFMQGDIAHLRDWLVFRNETASHDLNMKGVRLSSGSPRNSSVG